MGGIPGVVGQEVHANGAQRGDLSQGGGAGRSDPRDKQAPSLYVPARRHDLAAERPQAARAMPAQVPAHLLQHGRVGPPQVEEHRLDAEIAGGVAEVAADVLGTGIAHEHEGAPIQRLLQGSHPPRPAGAAWAPPSEPAIAKNASAMPAAALPTLKVATFARHCSRISGRRASTSPRRKASARLSTLPVSATSPVTPASTRSGAHPTPSLTTHGNPWDRASLTTRPHVSECRLGSTSRSAPWK